MDAYFRWQSAKRLSFLRKKTSLKGLPHTMFFFTNRIDVNDEKQANEMEEEKRLVLEKNE